MPEVLVKVDNVFVVVVQQHAPLIMPDWETGPGMRRVRR